MFLPVAPDQFKLDLDALLGSQTTAEFTVGRLSFRKRREDARHTLEMSCAIDHP
jgi:hypothetical protein